MALQLEHIGIMVSDVEKSLAFYQKVFGLELRLREKLNDKIELLFLHAPDQPNVEVELVGPVQMEHIEGLVNHLAFRVDNLEAEIARFKELGVEMVDEEPRVILGRPVKIAFFKGPDGEKLELVER